jgi:hypothetical protein
MTNSWRAAALLLLVGAAGCGEKDKVAGPAPSAITGTWNANKFEYVSRASPTTRLDLVAAGGTVKVWINTDRSFRWIRTSSGGVSDTLNGAWDMNEDQFTVEPIPTSYYLIWAMSLNGNTLTLTGAGMTYDFDGVGGPDPADHNMTLVR